MKLFQPIFLILLSILAAVNGQDCDAVCNERVQAAVQPITDEKLRAEEWGHSVKRELDEAWDKFRALEGEVQQLRQQVADRDVWVRDRDNWIQERDQIIADLRGNVETAQREADNSKREVEQIKHGNAAEMDELRTKAEEASRSLGRVQYALEEANEQIKEMESARFNINFKGLQEDVRLYWKNLLGWWTGLVMPDKKKDPDDL